MRDNPDLVSQYLARHLRQQCEDYYYSVRETFNTASTTTTAQAARFIYLNKSCFNGIYRVNQHGQFNVPYGHKDPPAIPSREDLRQVSRALATTKLRTGDYREILADVKSGDFVYLDPPYPPLNGTAYFTHYTPARFGWDDHEQLAKCVDRLVRKGAMVMISNADLPRVHSAFSQYRIQRLNVVRYITCRKQKHRIGEVVITSYALENLR